MTPDVIISWETTEPPLAPKSFLARVADRLRGDDPDLIEVDENSAWRAQRVLYAYVDPAEGDLLYLGKVWDGDVWKRFHAADKAKLWDLLYRDHRIERHDVDVIVGTPEFTKRSRLTKETLAYLEGLLIWHSEPLGNTSSKQSFRCRDGTIVRCEGDWPLKQRTFVDE